MARFDRARSFGLRACFWLASIYASGIAAPANASEGTQLDELTSLGARLAARCLELIWQGLDQQPSLMLAGAVASAVPVFGATAAVIRALGRRARRRAALRSLNGKPSPAINRGPNLAWLQVEDRNSPPLRLGELARIGCSSDCDLALGDGSVAGIHALVQRTPDSEFIIFDVSEGEAGSLAINGQPARRRSLRDGDRIEIGNTRVVFHAKWTSGTSDRPEAA